MISPAGNFKFYVASKPVDFRKGMDGLAAIVQNEFDLDPFSGAIFIFRSKRADRLKLWSLVSEGPARAMGLDDRGVIATGKRADLVLVDWPERRAPAIRGTWISGRAAYRGQPAG